MKHIGVGLLFVFGGLLLVASLVVFGALGLLVAGSIHPQLAPFGIMGGVAVVPLFLMGVWASRD